MRLKAPWLRFAGFSLVAALVLATGVTGALAFRQHATAERFGALVIADPSLQAEATSVPVESLASGLGSAWNGFYAANGRAWDVYLDARTGVPTLVQGQGIPFVPGSGNTLRSATPPTVASIEATLRAFLKENATLLRAGDAELALNKESSGLVTPDLWQIVFDRVVSGVPVTGDRYVFYVGHGNLIAFGSTRWVPVGTDTTPTLDAGSAQAALWGYAGVSLDEDIDLVEKGALELLPLLDAKGSYETALAWRIAFRVAGGSETWQALVDAHSGAILAFDDANQYASVKGGVLPLTNDANCPTGCEQAGYPMPFADIKLDGTAAPASGSMGVFTCNDGTTASTTLSGTFVRVADNCGPVLQSVACDADLDLSVSTGTDCAVPAGASSGNTHSARSSFYHLNRIKEHARGWLPTNTWLAGQLTDNVNTNQACNAFWNPGDGTVNFFRSGSAGGMTCRNTGEIAAVFLHEWGHGLDQNDGGGVDNPGEAYADITSFLVTHASCIGRGFISPGGNGSGGSTCSGYGNACLTCTGVREMDFTKRANNTPQTPENWPSGCGSGNGPCGKEVHCEAYLAGETFWDLATRDLPTAGIDQQSAWELVDRMWYLSRNGSGGNAYTCGSPASNRSCGATTWFSRIRAIDDDDGNLANGTPHAAAIFAAFNRHNIPCGLSTDATNQSTSSCPQLAAPVVTATGSFNQIQLSWAAIPGASSYNIFRNDQGCDWGYNLVATVTGTTYTDTSLPNGFPVYYTVQAVGSNSSCVGTLASCATSIPGGPHAIHTADTHAADTCSTGGAGDDDGIYDAGEEIQFSLTVKNDGIVALTGVTATISTTTPGATVVNGTSSIGSLAVGASGTSTAPYYSVTISPNATCGSTIDYTVTITANEGSWVDSFKQTLGHPMGASTVPLLGESFDGTTFPPVGWDQADVGAFTSGNWARSAGTVHPTGGGTHSGAGLAYFNSYSAIAGSQTRLYRTGSSAIPGTATAAAVTFWMYHNTSASTYADEIQVQVSTDGTSWSSVGSTIPRYDGSTGWKQHSVSLNAYIGQSVYIGFLGISAFGYDCHIDDVQLTYVSPPSCTMHTCVPTPTADLAVTDSAAPDSVATQGDITYTIVVTNNGPDTADTLQLAAPVPANTTYRSIAPAPGWSCSTPPVGGTGTVTCSATSLVASSPATFTLVTRVDSCVGNGAVISGTASASASTMDPNTPNNTAPAAMTPVTDSGACDDGSAYTTNDQCVASVCTGQPVEAAPGPTPENGLSWPANDALTWPVMPGVASFRLYRGVEADLIHLLDGAIDSCLRYEGAAASASVPEVPDAGSFFWYLVTGVNGPLEGPAGGATAGPRIVNSAGVCP